MEEEVNNLTGPSCRKGRLDGWKSLAQSFRESIRMRFVRSESDCIHDTESGLDTSRASIESCSSWRVLRLLPANSVR